jgi:hypothetical protein
MRLFEVKIESYPRPGSQAEDMAIVRARLASRAKWMRRRRRLRILASLFGRPRKRAATSYAYQGVRSGQPDCDCAGLVRAGTT